LVASVSGEAMKGAYSFDELQTIYKAGDAFMRTVSSVT